MSSPAPPISVAPLTPKPRLPYMTGFEHFIQNIKPRVSLNNPGLDNKEVFEKSLQLWTILAPCEKMYWDKVASDIWAKYTRDIMLVVNANPQNYATYANLASYENVPILVRCQYCNCTMAHYITGATAQSATAQGAMSQVATAQGATAQGAMAQGAMAQGATAQGATAQSATAQGAPVQGATALSATAQGAAAQGAMAQGAAAQGATVQGATAQGATAQGAMARGATAQGYGAQSVRAQNEMTATSGYYGVYGYYGGGRVVYPTYKVDMEAGTSYKSYLYYGDNPKPEVRRFFLDDLESYKFEPLESIVRQIYNLKSQKLSIAWQDEDGDEVVMSSDAEVKTMLSEGQDGVLKLIIRCENDVRAQTSRQAEEAPAAAVSTSTNQGGIPPGLHRGVTCDGCGQAVIGHRYKCISCDNFDLCAKCETAGKHSHHCAVRVPHPNMSVPLLKASIKKSRRFLKSVASNAIEENKKLRRERRQTAESNTQGKQDSQPRSYIGWVDAFNKYMDEFVNIAGNLADCPERETATTEAATSTEPRTGETSTNVPTGDLINPNPWQLDVIDMSRLERACKYMRDNNLGETTAQAIKFIGSLDAANGFAPKKDLKKDAPNQTQVEKDLAEAGPAIRQEVPQETSKTYQGIGQPEQTPTQAALPDSVKMAQNTITGQGTPESDSLKDIYVKRGDISELANAVNKCELSSNASSCSEGSGYEKAEGWTVVEAETLLKDESPEASANVEGRMEGQEPIRQPAPLYPPLNAATAVFNPKESEFIPASASAAPASAWAAPGSPWAPPASAWTASASASAAPTTAPKQTEAKKATSVAAAIAEDLRTQIAPHVEAALHQMEQMGFSNESGWLTQLLDHHDGNIAVVLDLIAPIKGPKNPSAPNAPNARPK